MYVVTGGAGFIGSVIVAELNRTYPDEPVVVVDWLKDDERWKNLNTHTIANFVFPDDVADFLDDHEEDIKAVIHMGANSATTEKNVDELARWNTQFTLDLFNWCTAAEVPFIYASSASTYGNGEHGFNDNDDMDYLQKLCPMNAYGFSKHTADKAIVKAEDKPPQWAGLKFFNVYGPNEYHKGSMASVAYHTFNQVQATGKMKLFKSYNSKYADGEQTRDFVYVKDIAKAVTWLLDNPKTSGLFNLGSGEGRSFKDLATAVFGALNKKVDIEYIDMPDSVREHYQYFTQANMDKFIKATGGEFKPTSLEDGVFDYVQNYLVKDNPYL